MSREIPDYFQLDGRIWGQNERRETWGVNDTPEALEQMFFDEVMEMKECEANYFLKSHADFHMVSEVGDVGYVWMRYRQKYGQPPEHMTESLFEAMNIATRCGFTMGDAVYMKMIRNASKYPDTYFDEYMRHEDGVRKSKKLWTALGGDEAFFNYFMEEYGEE